MEKAFTGGLFGGIQLRYCEQTDSDDLTFQVQYVGRVEKAQTL